MSPFVVALTLTTLAPPPPSLPPAPQVAYRVERPMHAAPPCRDIDPGFIRYVPPPSGVGPLWAIQGRFEPLTRVAPAQPRLDCPRLRGAADR